MPKRDFKNVFGEAIIEPEQIRDTCLDQRELSAEELNERLQGRGYLKRITRQHERVCEIDDKYSIIDFSLKANSRSCRDVEKAYYQARNQTETWPNIKEGNSLILEHSGEGENKQVSQVSLLR